MRKTLLGIAGTLVLAAPGLAKPSLPELFALKVKRAETVSNGVIEHAVILIEHGKIVTIGQDLEIERGIPVIDRTDLVVTPGFVNCYSRAGLSGSGGGNVQPSVQALTEVDPRNEIYRELLELGVTTLGLYPPGNGIAGQAVAISTAGTSMEEMLLSESAYLKILMPANRGSRKMLENALGSVEKYDQAVEKAHAKWRKAMEKWKKANKKSRKDEKKDSDKGGSKSASPKPKAFMPPDPGPLTGPFIDVLNGDLPVVFCIRKAGDYLHLVRALGDHELDWSLRVPLRHDIDLYEVAEALGETKRRMILEPKLTLMPWTQRGRNIPAELSEAGARIAFIPSSDDVPGMERWRQDVARLIKNGLDRDVALAGMTIEPSLELGVGDRLGSLEVGKDANLLFFDGDPFQPSTNLVSVMSGGEFVVGEEKE